MKLKMQFYEKGWLININQTTMNRFEVREKIHILIYETSKSAFLTPTNSVFICNFKKLLALQGTQTIKYSR